MAPSSPPEPALPAAERWRRSVAQLEVPEAVRAGAPEPAWSLEPERFRWRPEEDVLQPVRPSRRRAREALPEGGSVAVCHHAIYGVSEMEAFVQALTERARRVVALWWPATA